MKFKNLYTALGILFIVIGLFFIFKPFVENKISSHEQKEKAENYKSQNHKKGKPPEISNDKSEVTGTIEIDSVDIKAPVYPGKATPKQLKRGVSFAEKDESLKDQNISITGHTSNVNSRYQFTPLKDVSTGDKVKLTIGNEKRIYEMTDIKNVKPDEVEVMDEHKDQKDQLTLITCDNFNEQTGVWENRSIYVAKHVKTLS